MTTLYNPLDQFQTYSIHHVLIACRTTEEAKAFTNESKNMDTLQAINEVKSLGDAIPYGNKDTAFLVMDTRRFSHFSVANFKNEVLINGVEQTGSHSNLATSVSMTIVDSVGISFINFLQWLMDERMQTNFDGIIFMHRIIFVGHTPDGNTETVQSITIPMMLLKLELNLDHAKGSYAAEFMPNMNFDTTRNSRWMNIWSASRYFTGLEDNTLGSLVRNFETQLNKASQDYFNAAQTVLQKAGQQKAGSKGYGRLVQYRITLPKEWYGMTFTGAATAAATETIFKKTLESKSKVSEKPGTEATPGSPKNSHLAVEPGMTITEVLDLMFSQVKDIAALGAGIKTPNSVKFYKHFTGITSDDSLMMVQVHVVEFEVPNVVPSTGGASASVSQFYRQLEDGSTVPKNYAEFDYIHTGKNKDILNFDMKVENLLLLLSSNLNIGPGAVGITENPAPGSDRTPPNEKVDKRAELITARPYDALLLPQNSENELKNFSNYTSLVSKKANKEAIKTAQDYTRNLSMFYAMSPITVAITIRGNPDIMGKFNQSSFLTHKAARQETSPSSSGAVPTSREQLERDILKNNSKNGDVEEITQNGSVFRVARTLGNDSYATSPVFVKINIKGPKVDFRTGVQNMNDDFAEELIQNNFYTVMKVTNIIEGHTFTQELELYSHNIFGLGKISPPEAKQI